ncbi:MAG: thiolase [Betaproteobacteria bacterium]|nr:thiolase [Betaproteobacteria bacterium]MBI2959115.1 thiolase [Betaproteobacteria bacterium]
MNERNLRARIAVAGVATAGCGEAHGFGEIEILAQAAKHALDDAGLRMRDVDGLCTANLYAATWPLKVAEYLKVRPKFTEGTNIGGSAFAAHILPSMLALDAGICDVVLVCYGSTQRTSAINRKERRRARYLLEHMPFEGPYEPFDPPSSYALMAARHMHQYGTTRRQLAEVAVAARAWAQLNPEAFARDPLSIDDVLGARMISDPFTKYDCCLVTDGACAFVLVRAERAKDLPKKPVYVLGSATAVWHRSALGMDDLTVTPSQESGKRAFAMAGLGPEDIDVFQTYDAFTINTILALEDLGFCAKGEGGPFVENGAIAPGGRLPVNTNGGGLSCVHPNMYSGFATIEAVRQLRGECGARQVKGAKIALVNGNGGLAAASQSTAVLATAEAL